jgi:hypothetical protein
LASRFVSPIMKPMMYGIFAQIRRLSFSIVLNTPPGLWNLTSTSALKHVEPDCSDVCPNWQLVAKRYCFEHAILSFDFLEDEGPMDMSEDALRKRRIWNGLCATQLHYVCSFSLLQTQLIFEPSPSETLDHATYSRSTSMNVLAS